MGTSLHKPNKCTFNNMYKGEHQITKGTFNLEQLYIKLVNNLISNIYSGFPNTPVLYTFNVLSPYPICFMSEEQWKVCGEKLKILIIHYGHEQIHKWFEDGDVQQMIIHPFVIPKSSILISGNQ